MIYAVSDVTAAALRCVVFEVFLFPLDVLDTASWWYWGEKKNTARMSGFALLDLIVETESSFQ